MKPLSIAAIAFAAAVSLVGCGLGTADWDGANDPTLGSYDEPLTTSAGAATCNSSKKVLICHIPPGNPANAHAICVGKAAQPAHLGHGDTLGDCGPGTTGGGTGGGAGGTGGGTGGTGGGSGDSDAGQIL